MVCSLFSNSLAPFERFCSLSSKSLLSFEQLGLSSGVPFLLNFASLFRRVCSLFSNALSTFRAVCSLLLVLKFSSRMLLALKLPCHFRSACSLFSNSLVIFGRLAPKFTCPFRVRCSFVFFLTFLKPVQVLYTSVPKLSCLFLSNGLLLVLKFSNLFRAACSWFSNSPIRFAPSSQIL